MTNDLEELRDADASAFAVPHRVYQELAAEDLPSNDQVTPSHS